MAASTTASPPGSSVLDDGGSAPPLSTDTSSDRQDSSPPLDQTESNGRPDGDGAQPQPEPEPEPEPEQQPQQEKQHQPEEQAEAEALYMPVAKVTLDDDYLEAEEAREGSVDENGDDVEGEDGTVQQAMPKAKLTLDEESAEENGDEGLQFEEAEDGADGSEASFGSGESYDSALERIAASSSTASPKGTPVGSFHDGATFSSVERDSSPSLELTAGNGRGVFKDEGRLSAPVAKLTVDEEEEAAGYVGKDGEEEVAGNVPKAMPVAKLTPLDGEDVRDEPGREDRGKGLGGEGEGLGGGEGADGVAEAAAGKASPESEVVVNLAAVVASPVLEETEDVKEGDEVVDKQDAGVKEGEKVGEAPTEVGARDTAADPRAGTVEDAVEEPGFSVGEDQVEGQGLEDGVSKDVESAPLEPLDDAGTASPEDVVADDDAGTSSVTGQDSLSSRELPAGEEVRTKGVAEPHVDAQAQTEPGVEPKVKPEAESESKPEAEPESKPEAEPESKPEAEPGVKPEAESVAEPETDPEAKPEAVPEVKPEDEPEAVEATDARDEPVEEKGENHNVAAEEGALRESAAVLQEANEDLEAPKDAKRESAAVEDEGGEDSPVQGEPEEEVVADRKPEAELKGEVYHAVPELDKQEVQSYTKPAFFEEKKVADRDELVDSQAGEYAEFPFVSEESEFHAVLDREDEEEAGDWDEDIEEEDEDEADILMERSAALAALVHGADSSSSANLDGPSLGAAGPSLPARPAGLGRSAPSLEPAPRTSNSHRGSGAAVSVQPAGQAEEAQANGEANDGHEETREKLQSIRVKFLRLAHRLGQSAHNVVVAQVLYRLGLAEQLRGGRSSSRNGAFSFDRASTIAEEQEAAGPEELDFTCTIMLLGKTGVGKSATINSIFDEVKTGTNAFNPATNKVQEIVGSVHGIKVRVIDTPGLLPSVSDQRHNEKVMSSVKRFIKRNPPDIVLYFDRLDMQSRDYGDLPLLRTITDTFGPAVWFNAIVVLTHAASAPPDGPNGLPLSYEMFVAQRSHVVQHTIRQAAGDMRLMNPVSLVENHLACRTNRTGQRVLPNGQIWKPQLLLLCFASKILAEANSLLKLQDNTQGRPFGTRQRVPPLPFLLSSLLQSRQQLKLMDDQGGDEDESDEDLDDEEESEDEAEYDQLPPFRRLSREEVMDLDEQQRKEYFQELADRERLFQKKHWREELRRRKESKKRMAAASKEQLADEAAEEESARAAAVPVPLPDMVLPPSFDSDSPTHRYRYLETANQWLVRPVLETHGWDHDSGYDGFSVEKGFVVKNKIPAQISGQITKDKKEANLTMECAASFKHGEGKVTLSGLDVQTIGKDLAYTLRSETRFSNFKQNKTTAGVALTLLGDAIAAGLKLENRLLVGKRLKVVVNGGALTGRGDMAYGGSLEATLRDEDYPFSRTLSTLGLSIMNWHGDLAIGGNLQSQFLVGKTMVSARANLNNRGAGQISIRASSAEQLQMALIGVIPILRSLWAHTRSS